MIGYSKFKQLPINGTFEFECRFCGDCCRNVKSAVMLESLDLFRLARHLNLETAEVAERYAEVGTVAWGAPILVLKTKPIQDVCVFLKSGRCGIQDAKPRACRIYPLSVGPNDDMTELIALKSPEREFHYKGTEHSVSDWITANMDDESREYVLTESRLLREMGKVLRRIPRDKEDIVNKLMLMQRYFMFALDEDFMLQYKRNMRRLKLDLEGLCLKS